MNLRISSLLLATSLCTAGPLLGQADCEYRRDLENTVAATGGRLELVVGAGSLRINGRPDVAEVRVRGSACASNQAFLDEMRIVAESRDGGAYIETVIPSFTFRRGNASIDLEIEVPANTAIDLTDGSGSVLLEDVGGAVTIDDGSGSLELLRTGGDVRIEDGSGRITVADVQGSVTILEDGSGGIEVRRVSGDVVVRRDGSGGIDITTVAGSLTVGRDGSGRVDFQEIGGTVRVPRD
jgi:hypothetical protein